MSRWNCQYSWPLSKTAIGSSRASTCTSLNPASANVDSSLPGAAKLNTPPGRVGFGGGASRYLPNTIAGSAMNGLRSGGPHAAKATRPPGLSASRTWPRQRSGSGMNMIPLRSRPPPPRETDPPVRKAARRRHLAGHRQHLLRLVGEDDAAARPDELRRGKGRLPGAGGDVQDQLPRRDGRHLQEALRHRRRHPPEALVVL